MQAILDKLGTLWPEIVLLVGAVVCLGAGLNARRGVRALTPMVALSALLLALCIAWLGPVDVAHPLGLGAWVGWLKVMVLGVGVILLGVVGGLVESSEPHKRVERSHHFEAGDAVRGEFYAFFLLSLTGVLLVAGATDLVWLFLALELVSLPTYVMIATARGGGSTHGIAQESSIKYFFLGALSAAVFLYGFVFIYGATGFTDFAGIAAYLAEQGTGSPLLLLGLILSVLGLCFKIAAVPMHGYVADVYQGAPTPVTAFLAFVPKTAGFVAMGLLLSLLGGGELPRPVLLLLAIIAVLTMTLGNVLALVQSSVKRALAYSSVAHSGYLLLGLLGLHIPGAANGLSAITFYLLAYGLATIAGFAILGSMSTVDRASSQEVDADGYESIAGLAKHHPVRAGVLVLSMLSLLGLPPLAGFTGKVFLASSAFQAGLGVLVVVLVINSAISAGYYLRIASAALFGMPDDRTFPVFAPWRTAAAGVAVAGAVLLGVGLAGPVSNSVINTTPPGSAPGSAPGSPSGSASGNASGNAGTRTVVEVADTPDAAGAVPLAALPEHR